MFYTITQLCVGIALFH